MTTALACATCGTALRARAKFCDECGSPIGVPGTSAEYKVSEVADRNAGVVLKINKERLQALPPAASPK